MRARRGRDGGHPGHGCPGRGPNRARPTRTMVAPSSTATSKSSVMPIDSSDSSSAAAWLPQRGEPAAGVAGVGRHGHEAATSSPAAGRSSTRRRDAAPGGSRPSAAPRPGSPRRAPGRPAPAGRSRRRARRRSTDCQHATHGASARTLLRWSRPRKCQRTPTGGGPVTAALASSSWARFSPRSGTPASTTSWTRAGVDRLGRGDEGHRGGVAPGARGGAGDARPHLGHPGRDGRGRSAHGVRTTTSAWRPVTPSRRYEKWSGEAAVQTSTSSRSSTPACSSDRRTAAGMSSAGAPRVGARRDLGTEPVDQPGEEVGAELVAGGVDARTEHRRGSGRRTAPRRAATAALEHALLEAGPPGVDDADRVGARPGRPARSRR